MVIDMVYQGVTGNIPLVQEGIAGKGALFRTQERRHYDDKKKKNARAPDTFHDEKKIARFAVKRYTDHLMARPYHTERTPALIAASIAFAVAGNLICSFLFPLTLHVPIFMDSVFTVAVTLFAGVGPGVVTGILYNAIWPLVTGGDARQTLFALCSVATALITFVVMKNPRDTSKLMNLLPLSLSLCAANCFIGGIISTFAFRGVDHFPSDYIMAGLIMQDIPLAWAAILARIPLNLIDKALAAILGYGVFALADAKFTKKEC